MPKDNRIGRQTAHLAASSDEINQRFAALDEAFGEAWLSAGDHPLQALWQRNDSLAVNQLFLLGDAVGGLSAIDPRWVAQHVGKIKSIDLSKRRSSMFELLGVNLFRRPPQIIRPIVPPIRIYEPHFDAVLVLVDGAQLEISLKGYGMSSHEEHFRREAAATERLFTDILKEQRRNAVYFGALASAYPSSTAWTALRSALPTLVLKPPPRGQLSLFGDVWFATVKPLAPEFGPYSDRYVSYQVFMLAPFHANESKNLFNKFEDAGANARAHGKPRDDVARVLLMRVPERISLSACERWTKDYVQKNQQGPLDSIYLYQLAVADLPDGQTGLTHTILPIEFPAFAAWRSPVGKLRRTVSIEYAVGEIATQPTQRQIVGGPMPLVLGEQYVYQKGAFFKVFAFDPRGTHININNIASAIMQHAVLKTPDDRQTVLSGYFPPVKEITLFE
jgi:hypothetical protein